MPLEESRRKSSDSGRESVALQDGEPERMPAPPHHLSELYQRANAPLGAAHLDLDETVVFELAQQSPDVIGHDPCLFGKELITRDAAFGSCIVVADVTKESGETPLGVPPTFRDDKEGDGCLRLLWGLHVWFSDPADTGE